MKYLILTLTAAILMSCNSKPKLTDSELDLMVEEAVNHDMENLEAEMQKKEFEKFFTWNYSDEEDEMSSKKTKFASIASPDVAELEFPYQGGSYLKIYIRQTEGEQPVAYVFITDGQFTTDKVTLRYDDEQPITYSMDDSSDGDSKYYFFQNPQEVINKLKETDKLKIQCTFYNQGTHVFNFDTKDFKW